MADAKNLQVLCKARANGKHWVHDFHICENAGSLMQVLDEIGRCCYQLVCIFPSDDSFVVVFRRPLNG